MAEADVHPCVQFVGFRDDRFWNAVRIFGRPHFIHPAWDRRAQRDIGEADTVVFAVGDESSPLARFNAPDFIEEEPPYQALSATS